MSSKQVKKSDSGALSGNKDACDDRIMGPDGRRELSRMALLHVLFHYISMANLISYHVHSLLYKDRLFARGLIGAGVELALVLGRFANELWSNKIGVDDYMHHFAHLIGVGLVLYREDCRSYLYLLTRMNVLHFPCFLYYFACRKNGASFVNTYVFNRRYAHHIMDFARVVFPCLWISAVAYRSGSMVVAAYTAYRSEDGLSTAFVSLVLLASCLTYLDFSWSKYFLEEVGFPGVWYKVGGFTPAFIGGFVFASILLGLLLSIV